MNPYTGCSYRSSQRSTQDPLRYIILWSGHSVYSIAWTFAAAWIYSILNWKFCTVQHLIMLIRSMSALIQDGLPSSFRHICVIIHISVAMRISVIMHMSVVTHISVITHVCNSADFRDNAYVPGNSYFSDNAYVRGNSYFRDNTRNHSEKLWMLFQTIIDKHQHMHLTFDSMLV